MPFRNQSAGVTLFFLLDELNAFLQRHAREARRQHSSRRDGRIRSKVEGSRGAQLQQIYLHQKTLTGIAD
jgi:hypothetical protein